MVVKCVFLACLKLGILTLLDLPLRSTNNVQPYLDQTPICQGVKGSKTVMLVRCMVVAWLKFGTLTLLDLTLRSSNNVDPNLDQYPIC